jgi:hypothetical protein
MSGESYIRLTLGVYKVSQLFPEDPLKVDLRELADEILVSLLCGNRQGCSENVKLIQKLFDLAESRGLADPRNFLVLRREYAKIEELAEDVEVGVMGAVDNPFNNDKTKKRQEVILGILKSNGKVKIGDLIKSFPGITRRTILRDLDTFCQSGVVERNGSGRAICYNIKNVTL